MGVFDEVRADIKGVDSYGKSRDFEDKYQKTFDDILKELSGDASQDDYFDLLKDTISCGFRQPQKIVGGKILAKRKLVNWKKHPEMMGKLFEMISECEEGEDKCWRETIDPLLKAAKSFHIDEHPAVKEGMFAIIDKGLDSDSLNHPVHYVARLVAFEFPWKLLSLDEVKDVLRRFYDQVEKHAEISKRDELSFHLTGLLLAMFREVKSSFFKKIAPDIAKIFNFLKDQEYKFDDDNFTMGYELLTTIMEDYLYRNKDETEILKPCMDSIKELWECGEEILERDANNIMTAVAGNVELMGDDSSKMIDLYLSEENTHLICEMSEMYKAKPELFENRINEFAAAMHGQDEWIATTTLGFFWEVSKRNPEYFTEEAIAHMAGTLTNDNNAHQCFAAFQVLAEKRPKDIVKHDAKIMETVERLGAMGIHGTGILVHLAKLSKEHAVKYMDFTASRMDCCDDNFKTALIYNMRTIAQSYLPAMEKYRPMFQNMLKNATLKENAQACLDLIEGRSLAGVHQAVEEQRQDMDEMDDRLDDVEENVENLSKDVAENKEDIGKLREDVNEQEERLDELEEVVDDTVDKVEELDHKTLSHAPSWSRDVSVLINEEGDTDWRLLAKRLGYTNDDIRNWATQPNPALSMFDEWFATHKTREATYAIQKSLEEMNRIDASEIVERALLITEDVVEDSDEEGEVDPPPIFISYQWGHQQEVKLLRNHLEDSGYKAWMDVGQMGGGDKLYAKIDQGIRAAQVIICCVSEKYAQSPNCNREVNLSVTLGKPIIPLLMEKMAWPPPGTMGPIFSEYIFIRFFQRKGEETGDQRYWPAPKYQELLMQLRLSLPPDETIINQDSIYKDWWNPPEEIIVIKPREEKKGSSAPQAKTDENNASSPELFISYQWGKQPQIKALYKCLTQLGYTCWLDIMQMGGGDSLYDKIDKGIRGCRVVLSCVTSKYAISANCRREVSLADAIKKPIIPLLLEKMTWPPEGPMAMVLTQLLYIQFYKPDPSIQDHWNCPQFQELLQKIQEHVPNNEVEFAKPTTDKEHQNESKDEPPSPEKEEKPKSEPVIPSQINENPGESPQNDHGSPPHTPEDKEAQNRHERKNDKTEDLNKSPSHQSMVVEVQKVTDIVDEMLLEEEAKLLAHEEEGKKKEEEENKRRRMSDERRRKAEEEADRLIQEENQRRISEERKRAAEEADRLIQEEEDREKGEKRVASHNRKASKGSQQNHPQPPQRENSPRQSPTPDQPQSPSYNHNQPQNGGMHEDLYAGEDETSYGRQKMMALPPPRNSACCVIL